MRLSTQLQADASLVSSGAETRGRSLTHLMTHLTDRLATSSSRRLRQDLTRSEARRALSVNRVELLLASNLARVLLSDLDTFQEVLINGLVVAGGTLRSIWLRSTRVVLVLEALRLILDVLQRRTGSLTDVVVANGL